MRHCDPDRRMRMGTDQAVDLNQASDPRSLAVKRWSKEISKTSEINSAFCLWSRSGLYDNKIVELCTAPSCV
jgi:hypothetical protein